MAHVSTVISAIITITHSVYTITNTAILTPFNLRSNGARVMFNTEESPIIDNMWWDVHMKYSNTWQFIINADESFGIDINYDTTIEFTMNIPEIETGSLLFGFTTDNIKYISISIPMDNIGRPNVIYPACSLISKLQQLPYGDISTLPDRDRVCDISGGDCAYWQHMLPSNVGFNNLSPIRFKIVNNIRTNEIILYYRSESFVTGFRQSCRFAQHFIGKPGLKIYISGANIGETYTVSSFNITSQISYPTVAPTYSPTQNPTQITKTPTQNPTQKPTQNPTHPSSNPTITPTNNPTKKPTNNPTAKPTNNPTNNPTTKPTQKPTGNPTFNPTNKPSANPSSNPTNNPTAKPTHKPTGYTLSPTMKPSANPSKFPTFSPTTSYPTLSPTFYPTPRPTIRPTPKGYLYGAYNQLCASNSNNQCLNGNGFYETLSDIGDGIIDCSLHYDCCMCKTIECGFNRMPCHSLSMIGDYSAFGVKEIYVVGDEINVNGAVIDCQGSFACENTFISATNVGSMGCDGNGACLDATIYIINPKDNFVLDCAGVSSCEGLYIQIILPFREECNSNIAKEIFTFSKINCNANSACAGMEISIVNNGCKKVMITDLECIQTESCSKSRFNFIGDIAIQNCHCGPNGCDATHGLEELCFMENLSLINYICGVEYECVNRHENIINPRNGFEFICSSIQSCRNAKFQININNNPNKLEMVNYFSGIMISGDYSAQGATFIINNTQGRVITIDKIECNGEKSCEFATFIIGKDVAIKEMVCVPGACNNCYIRQTINSPGVACDPSFVGSVQQI